MQRTATQQLADIRLGRSLDEFVVQFRANNSARGRGWRAVSDALHAETGLRISHETLRSWYPDADQTRTPADAA